MIALDASAIICLVERVEPAYATLVELLAAHGQRSIVSPVAIAECPIPYIIANDRRRLAEYDEFWQLSGVTMLPVTNAIASRAAGLRAAFRLKTPDALHLATAIESGADAFATTDFKDFRPCVSKVPIKMEFVIRYPHQQPPP